MNFFLAYHSLEEFPYLGCNFWIPKNLTQLGEIWYFCFQEPQGMNLSCSRRKALRIVAVHSRLIPGSVASTAWWLSSPVLPQSIPISGRQIVGGAVSRLRVDLGSLSQTSSGEGWKGAAETLRMWPGLLTAWPEMEAREASEARAFSATCLTLTTTRPCFVCLWRVEYVEELKNKKCVFSFIPSR